MMQIAGPQPPMMEIKLIQKISLSNDGNRQRWTFSIISYLRIRALLSLSSIAGHLGTNPMVGSPIGWFSFLYRPYILYSRFCCSLPAACLESCLAFI